MDIKMKTKIFQDINDCLLHKPNVITKDVWDVVINIIYDVRGCAVNRFLTIGNIIVIENKVNNKLDFLATFLNADELYKISGWIYGLIEFCIRKSEEYECTKNFRLLRERLIV